MYFLTNKIFQNLATYLGNLCKTELWIMADTENQNRIELAQKVGYMCVGPLIMVIGIVGSLANLVNAIQLKRTRYLGSFSFIPRVKHNFLTFGPLFYF